MRRPAPNRNKLARRRLPNQASSLPAEFHGETTWLNDSVVGGRITATGRRVNAPEAMTLSQVFGAVRVIAEDVAKLPVILYRRVDAGGKERATDHPLFRLLHDEPNPEMGAFDFEQAMLVNAALWGNGYAEIVRNGRSEPVALHPLPAWEVKVTRERGLLTYEHRPYGRANDVRALDAADVLHVRGPSADGLVGLMIYELGAEPIGLGLAAHRFTSSFFANGTSSRVIAELPGKMNAESLKAWRQQFEQTYFGANAMHRPFVLDQGAKVSTISTSPEDAQLLETLSFSVSDIARYFRVSPHKLFDRSRAQGWSTLEHSNLEHWGDAILPWLIRTEQEYARKLLFEDEKPSHVIEHLTDALLRTDQKTRFETYQIAEMNGLMSRNEIRARENLGPVPGGDRFMVQQNMAILDDNGAPAPVSAPASGSAATGAAEQTDSFRGVKVAMMPVFVDAAERIIGREQHAIGGRKTVIDDWLDDFYAKHVTYVAEQLTAPIEALARMAGTAPGRLAERYAEQHCAESRRLLADEPDITSPKANFRGWDVDRPARMAYALTQGACDGPADDPDDPPVRG